MSMIMSVRDCSLDSLDTLDYTERCKDPCYCIQQWVQDRGLFLCGKEGRAGLIMSRQKAIGRGPQDLERPPPLAGTL